MNWTGEKLLSLTMTSVLLPSVRSGPKVIPSRLSMDRWLYRRSGGRVTVPGIMAGLPVAMLTTTGARSGEPRTMPLLGVPMGDSLAVLGTTYGQKPTPGWVYNLRADPTAAVKCHGTPVEVAARLATASETEEAFALAARCIPHSTNIVTASKVGRCRRSSSTRGSDP